MSILGITDTDNLISSALWHSVKLGKDVPNEIQGDIGTNVPWYCVTLSLYYNFLYLNINQPETNGPTASLEQNLESHLGTFCSLLQFSYNKVSLRRFSKHVQYLYSTL